MTQCGIQVFQMLASYQGRKSQQPFGSSTLRMINILVYFVGLLVSKRISV